MTQIQIFKLQIPNKCPLHAHLPGTVAGSFLPDESRGTALPETLEEGQSHQPEAEALISTVKQDLLQEPFKASDLVQCAVQLNSQECKLQSHMTSLPIPSTNYELYGQGTLLLSLSVPHRAAEIVIVPFQ